MNTYIFVEFVLNSIYVTGFYFMHTEKSLKSKLNFLIEHMNIFLLQFIKIYKVHFFYNRYSEK